MPTALLMLPTAMQMDPAKIAENELLITNVVLPLMVLQEPLLLKLTAILSLESV
jgi:hypothetical protein